ncbi:hypothetical protein TNCV_1444801 [Trichonephila clavipes]|nr:hypothetical protein TNCV_1444801 [Trichonephila clavipes]
METANHHNTWDCKPRLVEVIRRNSYEEYEVEWGRKRSNKSFTSAMQQPVVVTIIVRSSDRLGHSATETDRDEVLSDALPQIRCAGDVS